MDIVVSSIDHGSVEGWTQFVSRMLSTLPGLVIINWGHPIPRKLIEQGGGHIWTCHNSGQCKYTGARVWVTNERHGWVWSRNHTGILIPPGLTSRAYGQCLF